MRRRDERGKLKVCKGLSKRQQKALGVGTAPVRKSLMCGP